MADFDNAQEWVTISHPEVGVSPNKVHEASLDSVWRPLGWEKVDDTTAEAVEPGGDLNALDAKALHEVAKGRGVDTTGLTKKADLIAAIEGKV